MIERQALTARIVQALEESPVTALLGPRQCGKTTIAKHLLESRAGTLLDLEDYRVCASLANPYLTLSELEGLVVIDEIQRMPELFPVLRVLADRPLSPSKFLILGSASPDIVRGVSESLAGRVAFVRTGPFNMIETGCSEYRKLWLRGGLPRSFLAASDQASFRWRNDFVTTFLERDIPGLGSRVSPVMMRRFWIMLAHYSGQVWNASEIGRALGQSYKTVQSHLELIEGAFMVMRLEPWYENVSKRMVKSPKLYVRDSGLLHSLLGIDRFQNLLSQPAAGASWEGFALDQVLAVTGARDCWFWRTQNGAELDLLLDIGGRRFGFEFKLSESPSTTRSMRQALEQLHLDKLFIVFPGQRSWDLDEQIRALAITDIAELSEF